MQTKKELYDLNQDTRLFELKTYQITVNYDDEFLVPGTETFTVTQKIMNDFPEKIDVKLSNYKNNFTGKKEIGQNSSEKAQKFTSKFQ